MVLRKISLVLNIAMAVIVLAAWLRMALRFDENGVLTAAGLRSMKYFTVLSNLLQGAASLAYAVALALLMAGRISEAPFAVRALKYAAVVSVALTFMTVVVFLGPVFGFKGMYKGANLWFHLVVPLLAALDFTVFDRTGPLPFDASFLAIIPMLLYAVFYVANLLINGIGEGHSTNDWYGFARGGLRGAAVTYVVIILSTWLLALLLRLPRRA